MIGKFRETNVGLGPALVMTSPPTQALLPSGDKEGARTALRVLVLLLGMIVPSTPAMVAGGGDKLLPPTGVTPREAAKLLDRMPLSFELNRGQTDQHVKFMARGLGYTLFLTGDGAVLSLRSQESEVRSENPKGRLSVTRGGEQGTRGSRPRTAEVVRVKVVGANPAAPVAGLEELAGKSNYFIGKGPRGWHTGVPNYAQVRYGNVYPGIDVTYYGQGGQLENDFVVAPGADPQAIRLAVEAGKGKQETGNSRSGEGKAKIAVDGNGDLVVSLERGEVRFHKPVAYQSRDSRKGLGNSEFRTQNSEFVDARFVLWAGNQIGFEVGKYDKRRPLIIDPVLSYATYLGGTGGDVAYSVAVDSSGNAYVAGSAASTNFPTTPAYQSASGGAGDAFITKFNASGSSLIYSTYLGGNGSDYAAGIAIDSGGNAYVVGSTFSPNFPTVPTTTATSTVAAFQTTYGGNGDAFVAKLNAAGSVLIYSSYLGGAAADSAQAIALDGSGNAYVTGSTQSPDFPTANPLQVGDASCKTTVVNGVNTTICSSTVFVAKVNPAGTELVYSTYLGGSGSDIGSAIAVDGSGNAYLTGYTLSIDFPTQRALQSTSAGKGDVFVTEINADGSGLVYSTYLGGSGLDQAFGLALDTQGSVYVTGGTQSDNFPTTANAFQATYQGNEDAFIFKLAPGGSTLVYSTFLGGAGTDRGAVIALDTTRAAYVTGFTQSSDFPTLDPSQKILGISGASICSGSTPGSTAPCPDAFVSKISASGGVVYSTYLGGSGAEYGQGIAVDSSGAAYVVGSTTSSNFPAVAGAAQSAFSGTSSISNVFVAKVSPTDAPAVALTPQQVNFGNQVLNTTSDPSTVTLINAGSKPLNIGSITTSGDFAQTNTCGTTLPAGSGTCAIQITFSPTTSPGSRTEQLTITDNAQGSPQSVTVTGQAVLAGSSLLLSPSSLSFPALAVGVTSPAQSVLVTNNGTSAVTLTAISISGAYAQTNTCGTFPSVLNVGATCSISVTFTPTASGNLTGSVTISDDALNSPQSVGLSGTGSPAFSLSVNTRSTILEIGTTYTTFTVSASAPSSFTSNIGLSCSNASGATCSFNPTSILAGENSILTVSGLSATSNNPLSLTVAGAASSQTSTVNLSIFFSDYLISATPLLNTVTAGNSVTYTLTVSPMYGFNYVVLLGCVNLPQDTTCSWLPPAGTLDGKNAFTSTLTVTTTAQTQSGGWGRRGPPPGKPRGGPRWQFNLEVLGLALLALLSFSRRIWPARGVRPVWLPPALGGFRWAALVLILAGLAIGAGCNQYVYGPNIGTAPINGTPTGNYTIGLVGTLGNNNSVTRFTTVNLSVGP